MVSKVIVKPLAEVDIEDAVDWYFKENEKLAQKFLFEFKEAVIAVSFSPYSFRIRFNNIRAFSLKKFPYNIYYVINKETMYVIAVIHHKRHSKNWKKRK